MCESTTRDILATIGTKAFADFVLAVQLLGDKPKAPVSCPCCPHRMFTLDPRIHEPNCQVGVLLADAKKGMVPRV